MKRTILLSVMSAAVLATSGQAATRVEVNIGLAPPPPVIVERRAPPFALVPEAQVYVVNRPDLPYDCFRYGASFYIYNDGWWYRAPRYRGPYRAIEARYVPAPIWRVPQARWRHYPDRDHMPPGQAKKYYGEDRGRGHGYGNGNGNGNGHGRGHDHDGH